MCLNLILSKWEIILSPSSFNRKGLERTLTKVHHLYPPTAAGGASSTAPLYEEIRVGPFSSSLAPFQEHFSPGRQRTDYEESEPERGPEGSRQLWLVRAHFTPDTGANLLISLYLHHYCYC